MSFEKILFYAFSAVLVFAALMVITRRNPVHSALFLVLAFFSSAGIWMLAEAEFLAIVLVLVYVGAVMVLFLFVVMMLDVDHEALRAGFVRYLPVGLLVALLMGAELFMIVGPANFGLEHFPRPEPLAADASNTEVLGGLLYTAYVYAFEVAAVILLVAIIAAIGLTLRQRPTTKYLDVARQVEVKRGPDRIKLVNVPSEKRMGS
jgi:NADH-quinone oxidoreductase subunit J